MSSAPTRSRPAPRPPRRPGAAVRGAVGAARRRGSARPSPARTRSRRLLVGRLLLVLALAAATVRLATVQSVQADELRADSARQATSKIRLAAERGSILDRSGRPLAFSVESRALVTNPRAITTTLGEKAQDYRDQLAAAVAAATGTDVAALAALLAQDRAYVVLARNVDPDVARGLRDRFRLLAEEPREDRQYPGGTLAASVIGAAGWSLDDKKVTGRIGLESSQDTVLSGFAGLREVDIANRTGAVIPGSQRFERSAVPGADLQLTLDSDLQFVVQQILTEQITRTGAKPTSSAVVLDREGRVLAMANGTTFDPRDYAAASPEQLANPAVQSPFEPGSVNKVVTMAAALEYGLATPQDVLSVPGSIKVADRTVSDAWDHGTERYTLTGVLAKSSNVGTIMTAQRVGEERFADMLARFGLGARSGIELPGESPGRVPARETWSGSTFGNLPIGQGLSTTTLQMAGMYQAVANDGLRVPPRIVAATTGPDGVTVPEPAPEPVRVVSPQTAAALRTMLTAVTQDGTGTQRGTGHQAAVPGYAVAGKTGTAQQVDPDCGCYSRHTFWITFAGMLPADDPRYVIAVMLDAPGGGASAAPVFHDIATYLAQRDKLPISAAPPARQTLVAP